MHILAQRCADGIAALEDVAGLRAGAHGYDALWIGNLGNGSHDSGERLLGAGACYNHDIRMTGRAGKLEAETLDIIAGGENGDELYIAPVA